MEAVNDLYTIPREHVDLCATIGQPELAVDARFLTFARRNRWRGGW